MRSSLAGVYGVAAKVLVNGTAGSQTRGFHLDKQPSWEIVQSMGSPESSVPGGPVENNTSISKLFLPRPHTVVELRLLPGPHLWLSPWTRPQSREAAKSAEA